MVKQHYDTKTLAVFDIVGTYFVDVFYNHLYTRAAEMVKKGAKQNITDAYKENIFNYQSGLKIHSNYVKTLKNLHEYYQQWTTYSAIIFSEFQDKILSNFIPMDYYRDFSNKDKDSTLYAIIMQTVNELVVYTTSNQIFLDIIDNHGDKDFIAIMQDETVDMLILQREEYYNKFYSEQNKTEATVSKNIFKKLKKEYILMAKKNLELEDDRKRAVSMLGTLINKLQIAEKEIGRLNNQLRAGPSQTLQIPITDQQPNPSQTLQIFPTNQQPRISTTNQQQPNPFHPPQIHPTDQHLIPSKQLAENNIQSFILSDETENIPLTPTTLRVNKKVSFDNKKALDDSDSSESEDSPGVIYKKQMEAFQARRLINKNNVDNKVNNAQGNEEHSPVVHEKDKKDSFANWLDE